jgi:hypothetical protein
VKVRISTSGGNQPQWRGDGKELFYIAPDNTIYGVPLTTSGTRVVPGTHPSLCSSPTSIRTRRSATSTR